LEHNNSGYNVDNVTCVLRLIVYYDVIEVVLKEVQTMNRETERAEITFRDLVYLAEVRKSRP